VSKAALDRVKNKTGVYFAGLCPDYYSSFILTPTLKNCLFVDYPISFYGASPKSNSGLEQKNYSEIEMLSAKVYKNPTWPNFLPEFGPFTYGFIAEALATALTKLGRQDLLKKYNLALFYASCLASKQSPKTYLKLLKKYFSVSHENFMVSLVKLKFYFFWEVGKRVSSRWYRLFHSLPKIQTWFPAENILEAEAALIKFLKENNWSLKYPVVKN